MILISGGKSFKGESEANLFAIAKNVEVNGVADGIFAD